MITLSMLADIFLYNNDRVAKKNLFINEIISISMIRKHIIVISSIMILISFLCPHVSYGEIDLRDHYVIRFIGKVDDKSVENLLYSIQRAVNSNNLPTITILISSTGGSLSAGIAAYNYIKGLPKRVTVKTHNIAVVSIPSILIFCAGTERSSAPIAHFIVTQSTIEVDDKKLESSNIKYMSEYTNSYNEQMIDIIAKAAKRKKSEVSKALLEGATLTPYKAKILGLVHKIQDISIDDGKMVRGITPSGNY